MKTELKKLRWVKSYGQIKIDSENMAVSFVFWPHFSQNLKQKVATFLMHYFFTSLSFCVQNGQQNGMKVRNKWFSNNLEIQDTLPPHTNFSANSRHARKLKFGTDTH